MDLLVQSGSLLHAGYDARDWLNDCSHEQLQILVPQSGQDGDLMEQQLLI
jgi:hypothetical protein